MNECDHIWQGIVVDNVDQWQCVLCPEVRYVVRNGARTVPSPAHPAGGRSPRTRVFECFHCERPAQTGCLLCVACQWQQRIEQVARDGTGKLYVTPSEYNELLGTYQPARWRNRQMLADVELVLVAVSRYGQCGHE